MKPGTVKGSEEQVRNVVSHYLKLQGQLSQTTNGLNQATFSKDEVIELITSIRTKANGVGESLSNYVPRTVYNQVRSGDSIIAMTVFQMPELLELILEHNTVFEVLKIYQACRTIKDIIDGSPRLQAQLFLRPVTSIFGPFARLKFHPLLDCDHRFQGEAWFLGEQCQISISSQRTDTFRRLPHVGRMWKSMQICQPPLMSIAIAHHDILYDGGCDCRQEISTGRPLTFGDLYEKAKEMLSIWYHCCMCGKELKHKSEVVFVEGSLDLEASDMER